MLTVKPTNEAAYSATIIISFFTAELSTNLFTFGDPYRSTYLSTYKSADRSAYFNSFDFTE